MIEGYEVGYGKPPKATRFKPERSGNPKGRPRGSRTGRMLGVRVARWSPLIILVLGGNQNEES